MRSKTHTTTTKPDRKMQWGFWNKHAIVCRSVVWMVCALLARRAPCLWASVWVFNGQLCKQRNWTETCLRKCNIHWQPLWTPCSCPGSVYQALCVHFAHNVHVACTKAQHCTQRIKKNVNNELLTRNIWCIDTFVPVAIETVRVKCM